MTYTHYWIVLLQCLVVVNYSVVDLRDHPYSFGKRPHSSERFSTNLNQHTGDDANQPVICCPLLLVFVK